MPDYRPMPDICTLTVRAKKLGIVCPYPMGATHLNTGNLEKQQENTQSFGANPHVPLGGKQTTSGKKTPPGCSCLNRKHRPSLLQLFGVTDNTSHF